MPIPDRPRLPTSKSHLQWLITDDGSRTLFNLRQNEAFHSGCGAVAETLVVYLWYSQVADRLRRGLPTSVLEYGLGTGMGLLLTAALAEYHQTPLYYVGLELELDALDLLAELDLADAIHRVLGQDRARSHDQDPGFALEEFSNVAALQSALERALHARHLDQDAGTDPNRLTWQLSPWVQVVIRLGDARTYSTATEETACSGFDAIYFDPFSPESNPEMWTAEVLTRAAGALRAGGVLCSYCVKSSVRGRLTQAGLHVERRYGPLGGKRQVLIGTQGSIQDRSCANRSTGKADESIS